MKSVIFKAAIILALSLLLCLQGANAATPGDLELSKIPDGFISQIASDNQSLAETLGRSPYMVNFFASWCKPCRMEMPELMQLSRSGTIIIGVAYMDKPENTSTMLAEAGNPYRHVLHDQNGFMGSTWGIQGVPQTFMIDDNGSINSVHTGYTTKYDLVP